MTLDTLPPTGRALCLVLQAGGESGCVPGGEKGVPCSSEHSILSSQDRVFRRIFSSPDPRKAELGAAGVSPGPAICNGRLPGNQPLLGSPPVDVTLGGRGGEA